MGLDINMFRADKGKFIRHVIYKLTLLRRQP